MRNTPMAVLIGFFQRQWWQALLMAFGVVPENVTQHGKREIQFLITSGLV